ncbi:MAG: hypothetical protein ACYDAL_13910 [Candidatus Dormibacteraceae bacterium]
MAAVLGGLAEQLRLQREDVVEHAIESPSFQAMIGDHAGALEMASQRSAQRSVDAGLPFHLRLFEQLQAAVERELL